MKPRTINFPRCANTLRVAFALFFGFGSIAYGQAITGTLLGTVTDTSGAVMANAKLTTTNQSTGISSSRVTDVEGNYVAPYLAPGLYTIMVEYGGFRTVVSKDNIVQVNQTTRVDLTMSPGAVTEHVDVQGTAPLVQSTTSEIGHVIQDRQIGSLPLNGRLFEQLVTLTPGALAAGFGDFGENPAAAGARTPIHATVNGLPWSGNHFLIDGVTNSEPLNAFINITPPLEAIAEFKVQTNNPTAEFGAFGGAIVNLAMKSGTNELHGSAFEYLRNDALNARNFFSASKAPFRTNQFGGTAGGPIQRNKLFVFADYQGMRQRNGRTFLFTVPTALQRQGVLTEGGSGGIYDPMSRLPFPNRTIPASRLNPITAQVARNIYPQANLPGLVNNYVENNSLAADVDQFDVKGDWQLSSRDQVFARESFSRREMTDPSPGNQFMNGGPGSNSRNQNAVLGYTHSFSANRINEFRVGFNRYATSHFANDFGIAENNQLGIVNGNLPGFPETFGIAQFSIPGFRDTGGPGWTNAQRIANSFQYTDSFTWILSRHTLKFGGDFRRIQSTLTNPQTQPRGLFEFNGNVTSNLGAAGTGDPWASFLLGDPWHVARDVVNTRPGVRMFFSGLYAQDDYRITPKLTLNLGLRWDVFTRPVEKYNRQSNFDLATGLIDVASADNRGPNIDTFMRGWGPRAGLAYSPDNGRTAFRAAYGLSYFPDNFGATGGTLERNYPFFLITDLVTPTPYVPFRSVSEGLPGFTPVALQPQLQPPPGFAVWFVSKDFRQDMAQMWNASIQRKLPGQTMVEAAYVATRGTHLYRDLDLNVPLPGPGAIDPRRPYYSLNPNIPSIHQRNGDGASSYQSAQFKAVKQAGHGLTLLAAYTVSKSIDNMNVLFPYLDSLNRGLSSNFKSVDIPQNFVLSYVYELPFGRGRALLSQRSQLVDRLAGGWSVNGITTFRSGQPLAMGVASSLLNTGTGNRADITCSSVGRPKRLDEWFDTSCFASPAPYLFGNSGVGHLRGPGVNNFDFSVSKDLRVDERRKVEFRAEFFNLFNHAIFGNPGTTLGTTSFGVISSTMLPSREVQMGLKLQF